MKIGLDLNNNGFFGDNINELLFNQFVAEVLPYALNTSLDLSTITNDGTAKYMRIIGDYDVITPCLSSIGKVLDL